MSWVYLDDQFPEHPKVVRAGEAAAYLFVCGLAYCKRQGTDGVIPKAAALRLVATKAKQLAARLVDVGLWEDGSDTFVVHDYTEWNRPSTSRSEAGRKAARARWDNDASRNANASESHSESASDPPCERIEIADASRCTIPSPYPSLDNSSPNGFDRPPPEPVDESKIEEAVWAYAELMIDRVRHPITDRTKYRESTIERAMAEHGDKLRRWLHMFDITPRQAAAGLIDGTRGDWKLRTPDPSQGADVA